MKPIFVATLVAGLFATTFGNAATPAVRLTVPDYSFGEGSVAGTVGFEFTVSSPEEVTALGVFTGDAYGLCCGPAQVGIWDTATAGLLVAANVPDLSAAMLDGLFAYIGITPLLLEPGTTYLIGASVPDENFTSIFIPSTGNSFAPGVMFIEGLYSGNEGLVLPSFVNEEGTASFGPNFLFTPVPEPSTWAMMALGFAALGLTGYRTSRKRPGAAA
jgi:hypothetical protein